MAMNATSHTGPVDHWYALYQYDKTLLIKPQSINDEDITCQYPSKVLDGSPLNLDIYVQSIDHARISGQIAKRINALKARTPSMDEVLRTVTELDIKLQKWRESQPHFLGLDPQEANLPPNIHPTHAYYKSYAYYGSLITIHSILVHPWNALAVKLEPGQKQNFMERIAHSTDIVVGASRKMIQNLRHITINAASPKW